jgi:hypothetical protein
MLTRLAEIGMQLAEAEGARTLAAQARAAGPKADESSVGMARAEAQEAGLAFSRFSRSVQRSLSLRARAADGLCARDRAAAPDREAARKARRDRHRDEVREVLHDMIWDEVEDDGRGPGAGMPRPPPSNGSSPGSTRPGSTRSGPGWRSGCRKPTSSNGSIPRPPTPSPSVSGAPSASNPISPPTLRTNPIPGNRPQGRLSPKASSSPRKRRSRPSQTG